MITYFCWSPMSLFNVPDGSAEVRAVVARMEEESGQALYHAFRHLLPKGTSQEKFAAVYLRAFLERMRGKLAAALSDKTKFVEDLFGVLKGGDIAGVKATGAFKRSDFEVTMANGDRVGIELKGSLDGQNAVIFERPAGVSEFHHLSLASNPGSALDKNLWSGVGRLINDWIVDRNKRTDSIIVWAADWASGEKKPIGVFLFPKSLPEVGGTSSGRRLEDSPFLLEFVAKMKIAPANIRRIDISLEREGESGVRKRYAIFQGDTLLRASGFAKVRRERPDVKGLAEPQEVGA